MKILSSNIQIIGGSVRLTDDFFIEGQIDGDVESSGHVELGPDATINGTLTATSVSIQGTVTGNITAYEYCSLRPTSTVEGDILARHLGVDPGAVFFGESTTGLIPVEDAPRHAPPARLPSVDRAA